jgi:phage shock protein E
VFRSLCLFRTIRPSTALAFGCIVTACVAFALFGGVKAAGSSSIEKDKPAASLTSNDLIDWDGFRADADEAELIRQNHRLNEAEFLQAMNEPRTVLLDARSARWFDERHIDGAVNLPFTDWTEETLAAVIGSKDTKVLIYCNNNFLGDQQAFASKAAPASLNISSFTSLVTYGYKNVYELAPLLSVDETVLPFVGTTVSSP